MDALKPQDPSHIGTHTVLARLGAGGMGRVYLGRSPGGRLVAIKVIRDEITDHPEALTRFRREVETARAVRSAYTANLIDASLDAAPYWLATEYVAGPTLAKAVAEHGPLPPETCLGLFAALAEGLAAVHAHGVTHRDLKPQNVILAAQGPQLIDFGIARGAGQTALTDAGFVPGTPGFTAPEVLLRNEVGPSADVFALGATLAYAATGRAPFGSGDPNGVSYRAVHEAVDLAGVAPELGALIEACAAKDAATRPGLAEVIARCGVRTALVEDPVYAGFAAQGEATPQMPPTPARRPVAPPVGPHDLPTVGPAPYGPSGYTPTELAARPSRGPSRRRTMAVAVGLVVGVSAAAALVLTQRGDGKDPARGRASASAQATATRSATGKGGPPAYAGDDIDRTFWQSSTAQCQLPTEEHAPADFMTSVSDPDDPAKSGERLILDRRVKIGIRSNGYASSAGAHAPYYVTVSVKPPHSIDPSTGKPAAGVFTPNVTLGYTSKPVDLYGGDATSWKYLTYPDDFRSWHPNGKQSWPAIPLTNDPGDWTVEWHHIRTPHDYSSIMCGGFTVK
ncbi:Serine/threonine-protein kinase PknD [Streptomyces sp. RB17]|uniref:serine/threonine-protein kinase n=1 Tax=Streptomyces sp. RB17 TaxID=2585197 RepID=UPI001308DCBE|nr:serine/threonine-protein kinase [Streptomyces sp. RB17]MQY38258.1 Serine/threonine-protein kinase PknD [Streptomyces sp. RB17]